MTQSTDELRAERERINAKLRAADAAERAQIMRVKMLADPPVKVRADAWAILFAQTTEAGRDSMRAALEEAVDAEQEKRRQRSQRAAAARWSQSATEHASEVQGGEHDDAVE